MILSSGRSAETLRHAESEFKRGEAGRSEPCETQKHHCCPGMSGRETGWYTGAVFSLSLNVLTVVVLLSNSFCFPGPASIGLLSPGTLEYLLESLVSKQSNPTMSMKKSQDKLTFV